MTSPSPRLVLRGGRPGRGAGRDHVLPFTSLALHLVAQVVESLVLARVGGTPTP